MLCVAERGPEHELEKSVHISFVILHISSFSTIMSFCTRIIFGIKIGLLDFSSLKKIMLDSHIK
jgi:hypothetical protein